MDQGITGFHLDECNDWVAELACGHNQHVRRHPPWTNRPWVVTPEGRAKMCGQMLACKKCDEALSRPAAFGRLAVAAGEKRPLSGGRWMVHLQHLL